MRLLIIVLVACVAVVSATVLVAVTAVLLRAPSDPPIAVRVPDLAFWLPGVDRFVEWEATRDARRAFHSRRRLLLGYNHGRNVGELTGCLVESYDEKSGWREDLPEWVERAAIGKMTVTCGGSAEAKRLQFTVLECGNPFDTYQVVYGRAFNEAMLRLARSRDGSQAQTEMEARPSG